MTDEGSQPVGLAVDAAGMACSVAVAVGDLVAYAERAEGTYGQAEKLLPMVDRALDRAGLTPAALDLLAVTVGPGSFTGIRIGLAATKGIALATGARLIGVTSFDAVAATRTAPGCFLLVALESRREDLFVQLFGPQGNPVGKPAAVIPARLDGFVNAAIGGAPLHIAGDAAQRAAVLVSQRPDTIVLSESPPDAIGALRAALRKRHVSGRNIAAQPLYLGLPGVTLRAEHLNPDLGRA